jgi:hypothetical protein
VPRGSTAIAKWWLRLGTSRNAVNVDDTVPIRVIESDSTGHVMAIRVGRRGRGATADSKSGSGGSGSISIGGGGVGGVGGGGCVVNAAIKRLVTFALTVESA